MKQIKSNIDTNDDQFKDNVASYSRLIDTYRSAMKSVINRGEDSAVIKHRLRGKLDARSRIELLIYEKTPFLELYNDANGGFSKGPLRKPVAQWRE